MQRRVTAQKSPCSLEPAGVTGGLAATTQGRLGAWATALITAGLLPLAAMGAVSDADEPVINPGPAAAISDPPVYAAQAGGSAVANGQVTNQQRNADRVSLINAATNEAVDRLLEQISAERLADGSSVADLLEGISPSAPEKFRRSLRNSPQVGGPRFSSPRSAQVQLVERGDRVADRLLLLARAEGAGTTTNQAELERLLLPLRGRTFTATGGSMAPQLVLQLTPTVEADRRSARWVNVSEEAGSMAIERARGNAVDQLINAARLVVMGPHDPSVSTADDREDGRPTEQPRTLGDLMDTGTIGVETRQWLTERPVTRLRLEDDLRVVVKLGVEPAEWVQQLRVTMEAQETGLPALSDEQWLQVTADLAARVPEASIGEAEVSQTALLERVPVEWPARAPDWARMPITAQATAQPAREGPAAGSGLMTRQAAVRLAREQIRQRLDEAVVEGQTLGEIAQRHPHIRKLLDQAAADARIANASYLTDGSVQVLISIEGPAVWRALHNR